MMQKIKKEVGVMLTVWGRLKICWDVLTYESGHAHPAQEKGLKVWQRGYDAGLIDGKLESAPSATALEG